MNQITMKLQADHLILEALKEDISWKYLSECLHFWIRIQRSNYTAKTERK